MDDLSKRITRDLTVRTMAVLAALGAVAIASFLMLAHLLADAEGGAAMVDMAGRQRMLVERTALAASRAASLPLGTPERAAAARVLSESLEMVEGAHMGLLVGVPELKGGRNPSAKVQALMFGPDGDIDARLRAFVERGRALEARLNGSLEARLNELPQARRGSFPGAQDDDVSAMTAEAFGPLLAGLDSITAQYRIESRDSLVQLSMLHGGAIVAMLTLLMVAGSTVFRPMINRIGHDLRNRCRAEDNLRESEERLWRLLDESPVGISVSGRDDGKVVFANTRFCEILGSPRSEILGSMARELYVDRDQRAQIITELKEKGRIDDAEVEFKRRDGSPFQSLLTIRPTRFGGAPVNLAWIYDISAIKVTEEQLKLTAKVVETATEAVVITDAHNHIRFVNPAFTKITEYTADEVEGCDPSILQSGRHEAEFYASMWTCLREQGRWQGEIWNRRKSGELFAEWLSIVAITDPQGRVTHHIAVFSDITHRKEDEQRVWRQANYDALTGLPNRSLFLDRLAQATRLGHRDKTLFALFFIDLDGFKQVNDTLGHAAGDILLEHAGQRLTESMRASDTVARLAGDEFTVIVQGIDGRYDAAVAAAKIVAALAEPFDLDGKQASVRASVGIALFPGDAGDGPGLLKHADAAMYEVKRTGKNNFMFAADLAVTAESVNS